MKKPIGIGRWMRIAGFLALLSSTGALAQITIDKQITIQPIYVSNGTVTANPLQILFEAESDKIWSQAGIDINFLPGVTYVNGSFMNMSSNAPDSNSLLSLSQISGQPWSNGGVLNLASTVVKLFFVQLIDGVTGNLGFTLQSGLTLDIFDNPNPNQQKAMAIADNAFTINRIDVIAHELGHALGLYHGTEVGMPTLGAGGLNNLMSSPRNSPTFIGNIYPDGNDYDQLTGTIGGVNFGNDTGPIPTEGFQIDRARIMPIAVSGVYPDYNPIPEPATNAAIAGSIMLVLAGLLRWRRARAAKGANPAARA